MNVNSIITMNYKIFIPLAEYKNKPNSNPIKPNFRRARMNINSFITKDYRKKDDFAVQKNKPNSRKTQNECKYLYHKSIMKMNHLPAKKNKPKQTHFQAVHKNSWPKYKLPV